MSKPFVFFDDLNVSPPMWCAGLNDAAETYADFPTWREAFDYAYVHASQIVRGITPTEPTEEHQ